MEAHALRAQSCALRGECGREPAGPVDHPVTWHSRIVAARERPSDLPATTWPAEQKRDLAVRRDTAARDPSHRGADLVIPPLHRRSVE